MQKKSWKLPVIDRVFSPKDGFVKFLDSAHKTQMNDLDFIVMFYIHFLSAAYSWENVQFEEFAADASDVLTSSTVQDLLEAVMNGWRLHSDLLPDHLKGLPGEVAMAHMFVDAIREALIEGSMEVL